jgi:hypothetical protein
MRQRKKKARNFSLRAKKSAARERAISGGSLRIVDDKIHTQLFHRVVHNWPALLSFVRAT